jgi:hypothetical protein
MQCKKDAERGQVVDSDCRVFGKMFFEVAGERLPLSDVIFEY